MLSVVNVLCSLDNKVGLLSGASFDNMTMISHNNQTNRWISTLRYVSAIYMLISLVAFWKQDNFYQGYKTRVGFTKFTNFCWLKTTSVFNECREEKELCRILVSRMEDQILSQVWSSVDQFNQVLAKSCLKLSSMVIEILMQSV